jgi:hypothetical protein
MEMKVIDCCGFTESSPSILEAFDWRPIKAAEDQVRIDACDPLPMPHPDLMFAPSQESILGSGR